MKNKKSDSKNNLAEEDKLSECDSVTGLFDHREYDLDDPNKNVINLNKFTELQMVS